MSVAPIDDQDRGPAVHPEIVKVLDDICATVGLDPSGAELLKFTNNAVFRLRRHDLVVRIAGSATTAQRAPKVVRVARWLADHNVPAVRLLDTIEQPVTADAAVATVWHAAANDGPAPTGADLGRLLRRLHDIGDPPSQLPTWNPLSGIRGRLSEADCLTPDEHVYLSGACNRLEADLTAVRYLLPSGLVHGDATVANLIPSPQGPLLCDFDSTSLGPREWDLVPVATGHLRFGNGSNNQQRLATSYGVDITAWEGFPTLRRLRELQLVTSVLPVLDKNPRLHQQWRHRLKTFRSQDPEATWQLYR
jgi:aminoglycoside phosphotransferase (APT) family kinase protein